MAEYRGLKSILRQFYLKIKERLDGKADKAHTHTPDDITGTLPIAKGGTGADNGQAAFDNIVSGVRSSSAPADSETMLFHSTSWYKATVLNFWEYIKGKISSVLGLTASSYGGKASTAGTADKVVSTGNSGAWISGRSNAIVKTTTAGSNSGWKTLASIKTSAGSIETGNLSGEDRIRLVYSPDTNVSAGTNNVTNLLYIGSGSIEIYQKLIATASGIRIPTSQPSSITNGDIWIE